MSRPHQHAAIHRPTFTGDINDCVTLHVLHSSCVLTLYVPRQSLDVARYAWIRKP